MSFLSNLFGGVAKEGTAEVAKKGAEEAAKKGAEAAAVKKGSETAIKGALPAVDSQKSLSGSDFVSQRTPEAQAAVGSKFDPKKKKSKKNLGTKPVTNDLTTEQRLKDIDTMGERIGDAWYDNSTVDELTGQGMGDKMYSGVLDPESWQSAMGDAVKFLATSSPSTPPQIAAPGSGSVNFDAGSFYGQLNANKAQFNPYMTPFGK